MEIKITKDWCEKMATLEGDSEIGAGSIPLEKDMTECEIKLAAALQLVLDEENLSQQTLDRLSDTLNRICDALKGKPPEDTLYSWHDLPEVTQKLVDEVATLKARCETKDATIAKEHEEIQSWKTVAKQNAKHWWKLCGETTEQLAETRIQLSKLEIIIAQKDEEIERLKNELAAEKADHLLTVETYRNHIEPRHKSELAAALSALIEFGHHKDKCNLLNIYKFQTHDCNCGFEQALAIRPDSKALDVVKAKCLEELLASRGAPIEAIATAMIAKLRNTETGEDDE